jgi:hypothetical protein
MKNLRNDSSIVILRADKGNSTVVMNRKDYDTKILSMLNGGPYEIIRQDPTPETVKKVKEYCSHLQSQNKLENNQVKRITNYNQRCPIFYGVPKIHKENIPLRPIVDFRRSPTYNLASYFVPVLKAISDNSPFAVKNSCEFVDSIQSINIKRTESMVSFDAISLFTKVPIENTLLIIRQRLESLDSWRQHTKLSVQDIMSGLELCVKNTNFLWRGNYFSQKEGSAMGSPISPVFCEIFLQNLEEHIIVPHPHIKFYRRYVDDIFAIIKSRSLKQILADMNSFNQQVQFTVEEEENGSISFLDVLLTRKDNGKLSKKVYRKPTHTDKYLNFQSYHHLSQKISVIDSLVYRAIRICDDEFLQEELNHIKTCLMKNNYPPLKVEERIRVMKQRIILNHTSDKSGYWVAIPFIGDITYQLSRIIRKYLSVKLGYYTGTKLSTFLNSHKDKPSCEQSFPGIYSVKCQQCPKKYIGKTKRDYCLRFNEHLGHCRHRNINQSALALHMMENPGHTPDNNSLTLIEKEPRQFFRKVKEALHIKKCIHRMNTNEGWKVNPIWSSTLIPLLKPV